MKSTETTEKGYTILLTGGSGFLGSFIIDELMDGSTSLPVKELRVFDLQPLRNKSYEQVRFIRGDIRDTELLFHACKGVDLVIHAAAIVDWGTRSVDEILSVNYTGTLNILEACKENLVRYLVYTSSLDVLFDGNSLADVNENTPYPEHHTTSYCKSKYLAERAVNEANDDTLATCSLRPADIYGEADPYHIGSLVNMAKKGFYVRLGNGKSKCQHVYAGNVAYAHVLAAEALLNGSRLVSGQSYFITDGPGSNFFRFFDAIVEGAGYRIRPKNFWIPRFLAYGIGSISEFIAFMVRPVKRYTPKMSRFAVTYTCTDYTFSSKKAEEDFNFVPKYSQEEAFRRTVEYFKR